VGLVCAVALSASTALAAVDVEENGVDSGPDATTLNFSSGMNVTTSGGTTTIGLGALDLPLSDFVLNNAGTVTPLTSSSQPGLAGTSTGSSFIEWADAETVPVQTTFRVPDNYGSGGAFRVLVGRGSGDTLPPAIDFQVWVNGSVVAFDSAATDQTAVDLTPAIYDGSPEEKTLTVATDFAALEAGQYVTADFWRDNTNVSTATLELYAVQFTYTATQ
jgi:hypothetical protein